MIGYKAFNENLVCKNLQYEIGHTYITDDELIPCKKGFHFCKTIVDTYKYYPMIDNTRICKIEALGDIVTDDDIKYCTNKIKILEEVTDECKRKCNNDSSSSGYRNLGKYNSGDYNLGDCNSGNFNFGSYNTGNFNLGGFNSGYHNLGTNNSGDHNSGDFNSGDFNSGDYNSGEYNSGNFHSGLFNTEKNPKIKLFDKESDWTVSDWNESKASRIIRTCPHTCKYYIDKSKMTKKEKLQHPEYELTGGYIKVVKVTKKDKAKWWNELKESDKDLIRSLPNFDFSKFRECIGF